MVCTYEQVDPAHGDVFDIEEMHRLLETEITEASVNIFEFALERLVLHAQSQLAIRFARKLARWARQRGRTKVYLWAKFTLACILMGSEQYEAALREFYRVLSANTQDRLYFSAMASVAQTMLQLGDLPNAYSMLEIAYSRHFRDRELTSQSVNAARMLAQTSSRLGHPDRASEFYREAITRAHALSLTDLANEISREAGFVALPVEPTRNPQPTSLDIAAQMLKCNLVSIGVDVRAVLDLLVADEKVCTLV